MKKLLSSAIAAVLLFTASPVSAESNTAAASCSLVAGRERARCLVKAKRIARRGDAVQRRILGLPGRRSDHVLRRVKNNRESTSHSARGLRHRSTRFSRTQRRTVVREREKHDKCKDLSGRLRSRCVRLRGQNR